jgi:serine/threonine protein kinase
VVKQVMRQLVMSLKRIHCTGIVHCDIKPSNLVVSRRRQLKLINFGAATDLRIAKNYVTDRALVCVLPEETPEPPPEPIAAILSGRLVDHHYYCHSLLTLASFFSLPVSNGLAIILLTYGSVHAAQPPGPVRHVL